MSNVVQIHSAALQPITISIFSELIDDIIANDGWLLGDDASTFATHAMDLALLARIMDEGIREDEAIRTEATRIVRILQRRAMRDAPAGLVLCDHANADVVLNPDGWEQTFASLQPMPQGSYTMTITAMEQDVDAQGRSFLKVSALAA